jgi:hypothetical protein
MRGVHAWDARRDARKWKPDGSTVVAHPHLLEVVA